jgi:hypothetical protein
MGVRGARTAHRAMVVLLRIPNLSDGYYRLFEIVGYFALWGGIGLDF